MSRSLSEDLHNPNLFSEYKAGEYTYEANSSGKTATGSLQIAEDPKRDCATQSSAGGDSRRSNDNEWGPDDGGHLIAARFGGTTGEENLTAQSRNLNRSNYKRMENEWAAHLKAGDKVFVHIETDDPQRPNAYMGYVIYESPDGTRSLDAFHMINESRSEIAQWEEDAAEFEASEAYAQANDTVNEAETVSSENGEEDTHLEDEAETETASSENTRESEYLGEAETETASSENTEENEYLGEAETESVSSEDAGESEYLGDAGTESVSSEDAGESEYLGEAETESVSSEDAGESEYLGEAETETASSENTGESEYLGEAETESVSSEDAGESEYPGEAETESASSEITGESEYLGEAETETASSENTGESEYLGEAETESVSSEDAGESEYLGEAEAESVSSDSSQISETSMDSGSDSSMDND